MDVPCEDRGPGGGLHKSFPGVVGWPRNGNMLRDEVRGLL